MDYPRLFLDTIRNHPDDTKRNNIFIIHNVEFVGIDNRLYTGRVTYQYDNVDARWLINYYSVDYDHVAPAKHRSFSYDIAMNATFVNNSENYFNFTGTQATRIGVYPLGTPHNQY
jgi:hypothetical protein